MANSNGSSPTRVEVYESLHLIAQATQQITEQLERLRSAKLLAPRFMKLQMLAAHGLRAQIATSALHNLTAPELADAGQYANQHRRLEKELAQYVPTSKPTKK